MTWFKIDDGFYMNMKVVEAGNAAVGLWVRAGAWCSQQLTDGYVPDVVARMLGTVDEIDSLVDAELWRCVGGGYQFPDWLEYNPSSDEVKADKARRREAGKVGGVRSGAVRRSTNEAPASTISEAHASTIVQPNVKHVLHESLNPDPTRPDPKTPPPPSNTTPVDNRVDQVVEVVAKRIMADSPPDKPPRNVGNYLAGVRKRLKTEHADIAALIAELGVDQVIEVIAERELPQHCVPDGVPSPPAPQHDPDCPHCAGSGWRTIDHEHNIVGPCACTPPEHLATVTELRRSS